MKKRYLCQPASALLLSLLALNSASAGNYTQDTIASYLQPLKSQHLTSSQQKGLEIYTTQYLMDEGWQSMETLMEMTLVDAQGSTSKRTVVKKTLEEDGVPDKTLGIFVAPNDIKGTVMLTFEQAEGADNQWLFIPTVKRTKKINAENKSGSFVGSEFSWEDISTTELSKYTYELTGETDTHWQVVRVPIYGHSGYSKQITSVNKANYQTETIEFYDVKGSLLKTLKLTDWKLYGDKYWRPKHFEMVNHQNGKQTILRLGEYKLGNTEAVEFTSFNLPRVSNASMRVN